MSAGGVLASIEYMCAGATVLVVSIFSGDLGVPESTEQMLFQEGMG